MLQMQLDSVRRTRGVLFLFAVVAIVPLVSCSFIDKPRPELEPGFELDERQISTLIDELALGENASGLVGAGDIARCDALEPAAVTAALVEAIVEDSGNALVFTIGDHAYERGTRQEFEQCYKPTWGRFEEITRPSPGNGHEHFYERFAPQDSSGNLVSNGITQFTVGTGGAELQPLALHRANRNVIYREGYGVLVFVLGVDRFDYVFVGTDGGVHDRSDGSVSCDA
jgi:hypothetical protein